MRLRRNTRALWLASWIVGFGLLVLIVRRTGPRLLLTEIRRLGWSFGLLILISGGRHILRTVAWSACMTSGEPKPAFVRLFGIRLVGEAATDLTVAGPLLGESLKVWLASARLPTPLSLSSVVLENLMYALGVGYFLLSGIGIVLLTREQAREQWVIAFIGFGVVWLLILLPYYILRQRGSVLTRILEWSSNRFGNWRLGERHQETLKRFEENLHEFYHCHRRIFYYVFVCELAANFTGVGEAYIVLRAASGHQSLLAAYLLEALNRVVTIVFAFIPMRLGVDEGSAALMMKSLGARGADGVTLALVRKLRTLVWATLGLCLAPQYLVRRKAA